MNKFLTSLTLMFSLVLTPLHAHSKPLALPFGLWEGINESGFTYKLLQINEDGQHYLFEAPIGTAFRHVSRTPFTNNDIDCSNLDCKITLPVYDIAFVKHLTLSPHFDSSFNVLESTSDKDDNPISSITYRLDEQKHQSSVRDFMDTYQDSIRDFANTASTDIFGLWVGIMRLNNKNELVSVEIYPDKKGRLLRFINGDKGVIQTNFNPEDIFIEDGKITIHTTLSTFANTLLLTRPISSVLRGYAYSIHKGKPLEDATLYLYRVQN